MFSGAFYLTISRFTLVLTGFLLNALLGRLLGPEQFGIFGVINSFVVILEFVLLGSTARGVSKFIAEDKKGTRSIINAGFKIQAVIGTVIFCIFFFGSGLIANFMNDPDLSQYLGMLSFLVPLAGVAFVYEFALNGVKAFERQAITIIVFYISRLLAVLSFVYLGFAVKGAILGLIISDFIRLLVGKQFCAKFKDKGDFPLKRLLAFSFQIGIYSLAGTIVATIDIMAIKVLLKENTLAGLYSAALTIARIPWIVTSAVLVPLFPLIAKSISDNNKDLTRRYMNQTIKYILAISIPVSFLVNATSIELLSFIFGQTYAAAAPSLNILIIGWSFLTIGVALNTVILAGKRPSIAVGIGMTLIFIDIMLSVLLVPRIGIVGAAWATTVTNIVGCILSGGYVFYHFKTIVNPAAVVRFIMASMAIYLLALFYPVSGVLLFVNYMILSVVFLFLLILLGEITLEDIRGVKENIFRLIPGGSEKTIL